MSKTQDKPSADFKVKEPLGVLRNPMTVVESIECYGVHKTMVYNWKPGATESKVKRGRALPTAALPSRFAATPNISCPTC